MHVIFHFTQIENEENNYLFPEITGSTKAKKQKSKHKHNKPSQVMDVIFIPRGKIVSKLYL